MPDSAQRYRKCPIVIEAMQWTGQNLADLRLRTGGNFDFIDPEDRSADPAATGQVFVDANGVWIPVEPGEWIIRDSRGFHPCKADVFAETYVFVQYASHVVTVEAESREAGETTARNRLPVSLCHQCAHDFDMGRDWELDEEATGEADHA
jgi:hypothetical protein